MEDDEEGEPPEGLTEKSMGIESDLRQRVSLDFRNTEEEGRLK